MINNLESTGRDGQLLQLLRAVARQCAKRATFIIMLVCLGFAASAQIGGDLRGGESTNASAMEETMGGGKRAAAELCEVRRLFKYFVGNGEERRRHLDPERLCCLEIDGQTTSGLDLAKHELRGSELPDDEMRRVAERTWR
jgi:hypothetical protein